MERPLAWPLRAGQFAREPGCGPLRAGGEGVSHILLPGARAFLGGMNVGLVGSFHLLERGSRVSVGGALSSGSQEKQSFIFPLPCLQAPTLHHPPASSLRNPDGSKVCPRAALSHQGWDLWGSGLADRWGGVG